MLREDMVAGVRSWLSTFHSHTRSREKEQAHGHYDAKMHLVQLLQKPPQSLLFKKPKPRVYRETQGNLLPVSTPVS